jgi:hypothetical protein
MSERDVKRSILPLSSNETPRELPPIPSGIEQLLAMAAVDERFALALRRDRGSAVDASGVDLSSTEAGILDAVDEASLERMVASVGATMAEQDRRAFLGRSAAALVALFGTATTASCQCPTVVRGVRPDRPSEPVEPGPKDAPASKPTAPQPTSAPTRPIGGLTVDKNMPQRGVRPDRPRPSRPMPTKGIRPKRPLKDPLD